MSILSYLSFPGGRESTPPESISILSYLFRRSPMGMNFRNEIIRQLNPPASLRLVKNKAGFARVLAQNNIPIPKTYEEIHDYSDMMLIARLPDEFVVKPCRGFGGKGIILLKRRNGRFVNPSGDVYSEMDIRRHIRKILDGDFSGYINEDMAIIQERIYPSARIQFKNAYGLSDIRVFCFCFEPVMAMLRYPTFKSKGRANLAAGGIGIGIDVASGRPTYIHSKMGSLEPKPEDLDMPASFVMPKWEEMKELAVTCSKLANLKLTGVDLILDASDQVRVLEVNGRPGLEIQNINEDSLQEHIAAYGAACRVR
ncbi:MAG: hypothetical protein HY673_16420 [Chloroflexi bacterium]|nr:hypothetical protein [Chloroflexota bacterium]